VTGTVVDVVVVAATVVVVTTSVVTATAASASGDDDEHALAHTMAAAARPAPIREDAPIYPRVTSDIQ